MKLTWRRFKLLGITILLLLIFIPIIVIGVSPLNDWYPIGLRESIVINLSPINRGTACITNNSYTTSYFIPAKTAGEWDAFYSAAISRLNISISGACCGDGVCNNGETVTSCPGDCASLCDYRPENSFGPVYTSAIYTAAWRCGAQAYCNFTYSPTPSPAPSQYCVTWMGSPCNPVEKYYYAVGASLITPSFSICQGDPCILGIDRTDIWSPKFVLGTYEHSIKTCMHVSTNNLVKPVDDGQSVYIDNYPSYHDGSYSFNTTPYFNGGTVGTWGSLNTQLVCGDGVCTPPSIYDNWETCSNCSADCGACAASCDTDANCASPKTCVGATCTGDSHCSSIPYTYCTTAGFGCTWSQGICQ